VFRNVGIQQSDAGEIPKRIHKRFKTQRKFEIEKHLIVSASVNQVLSYWLLPFVIQTMQHEDQGMICNTACPAMVPKVLKALNIAKLMNGTQSSL